MDNGGDASATPAPKLVKALLFIPNAIMLGTVKVLPEDDMDQNYSSTGGVQLGSSTMRRRNMLNF